MRKILLSSIIAVTFIGCTNLDEEVLTGIPESNYPENEAQISSVSVDAYVRLKPLCDDEGWWFWAQEVSRITSYNVCYTKLLRKVQVKLFQVS